MTNQADEREAIARVLEFVADCESHGSLDHSIAFEITKRLTTRTPKPGAGAVAEPVAWPPLKRAIWGTVTDENLNDGHYINAFELTEKICTACLSALARPPCREALAREDGDISRLPETLEGMFEGILRCAARLKRMADADAPPVLYFKEAELIESRVAKARAVRSGPSESLKCLRCGTIDAFGPISKERN